MQSPDGFSHLPHHFRFYGPSSASKFEWPLASRYEPDPNHAGFGRIIVEKIPDETTIIEDFFHSPSNVKFIKIYRLEAYPPPRYFMEPYDNVKRCEVRYFVQDFSKLFHFIADLPEVEELWITHSAICEGDLEMDAVAPMYERLRTSPTLKNVHIVVDQRRYQSKSDSQKFLIRERVKKIAELVSTVAPNMDPPVFRLPREIDMREYLHRFRRPSNMHRNANRLPTEFASPDNQLVPQLPRALQQRSDRHSSGTSADSGILSSPENPGYPAGAYGVPPFSSARITERRQEMEVDEEVVDVGTDAYPNYFNAESSQVFLNLTSGVRNENDSDDSGRTDVHSRNQLSRRAGSPSLLRRGHGLPRHYYQQRF